jgi:hypothetical protein
MIAQSERNAEIIRLAKAGQRAATIARDFGMKPGRVREIIDTAKRRETYRAKLIARYGANPDIAALPDDTPIDVLVLCDGNIRGWQTRVSQLAWLPPKPVATLGALRNATDARLRRRSFVGPKLLDELRRFCSSPNAGKTRTRTQRLSEACRALCMIRKVVEQQACTDIPLP